MGSGLISRCTPAAQGCCFATFHGTCELCRMLYSTIVLVSDNLEGPAYHLTNMSQSPTSLAQSTRWLHSKFLERRKSGSLIQWSPQSCSTAQASASDPTPGAHRNAATPRRRGSEHLLAGEEEALPLPLLAAEAVPLLPQLPLLPATRGEGAARDQCRRNAQRRRRTSCCCC